MESSFPSSFVEEDVDSIWFCPKCTFQNNIGDKSCQICFYNINSQNKASTHSTQDNGKPKSGPISVNPRDNSNDFAVPLADWQCVRCTLVNSMDNSECTACGYMYGYEKATGVTYCTNKVTVFKNIAIIIDPYKCESQLYLRY